MQSGNKEEYIDLVFERIDDASVLSNFYCGIQTMDDFIHDKLQEYLNKTDCDAYIVKERDNIVAMLSLGHDTLNLDDDDKDDMKAGFIPKPNVAIENQDSRCDFTPAEPPLGHKDTLRMYKVLRPLSFH